MIISIAIVVCLLLNFFIPFGYLLKTRERKATTTKAVLGFQVFAFFGIVLSATILMFGNAPQVMAEAATAATTAAATTSAADGLKFIAAALSTGMGSVGAGIAVASAASAALGALSEDSKIMGKALIFVALAEGVAIYGLLVSLLILFA